MISVFEYSHFRKFLCDYYEEQKKVNPSFSYAVMAKKSNISSRGLLKLIMDGKRKLSLANIGALSQGLELNKSESEYFLTLVQFNQSENFNEKNRLYLKLMSFPQKRKISPLKMEQYNLFSKWYYCVLYELILLKPESKNFEEFCHDVVKALKGKLTISEIREAYSQLLTLGLLKEEKGLWQQTQHFILSNVTDELNFAVQLFQREMMTQAQEALVEPLEKREFGTVTLAIKKSDLPRAKKFIKEFRDKFNFEFSSILGAESIYQFNLQFFELADGEHFKANPTKDLNSAMNTQTIEGALLSKEIVIE